MPGLPGPGKEIHMQHSTLSSESATLPINRILECLDVVHPKADGSFAARCPAHADKVPSLSVTEGDDGQVLLFCHAGCATASVVEKLGMSMAALFPARVTPFPVRRPTNGAAFRTHQGPGLTLDEYARYTRLPVDFLQSLGLIETVYAGRSAVLIRYPAGAERFRVGLEGQRFRWATGAKPGLYHLSEREQDRLFGRKAFRFTLLVEGESDAQAAWFHGLPAVGVPGAASWQDAWAEHVDGVEKVYVIKEPDQGGEAFVGKLAGSPLRDRLRIVDLAALYGCKDLADLHRMHADDHHAFMRALKAGLDAATPLPADADTPPAAINPYGFIDTVANDEPALPAVPPFPVDVLPISAREFVTQAAASLGVPVDLVAVPLVAYAGAALGNRLQIEVKRNFRQRAIAYVAVVAPPWSAKSAALNVARHGLDQLQEDAYAEFKAALAAWEEQVTGTEKGAPKPPRPIMEHVLTTDVTVEATAGMAASSVGMVVAKDEILSWIKSADAYRAGRGGDRQFWLSSWSGQAIKVDRKGADPIIVTEPAISIVGGIQPDLIHELADDASRRDGFPDRILWCYPDVPPSSWTDAEISDEQLTNIAFLFRTLRYGLGGDREHPRDPAVVTLDAAAKAAWVAWYDNNAAIVATTSGLAAGIAAKLPLQLARLCLILHALTYPDDPDRPVAATTMDQAIRLAEYFRCHANRVLPALGTATGAETERLALRIKRVLSGGEWVSRSEINNPLGGHTSPHHITAALQHLATMGHAERRIVKTERRNREEWRTAPG